MEILNISSHYAYTVGMVGVFIGVCLLITSLYHMVIGPLVRKRQLESRLKKHR